MAEYLFRDLLERRGLSDRITTSSCGVLHNGHPASKDAIRVISSEYGIDEIRNHRSTMVTQKLLDRSHIVLPMGEFEMNELLMMGRHPRVELFLSYAGISSPGDIADPYGGPLEGYLRAGELIHRSLPLILDRLLKERQGLPVGRSNIE